MDIGDILFYVIIGASAVGSIVKKLPKKADNASNDESKSVQESPMKKILEEINKWDDYIPSTPKPAPKPQTQSRPMAHPLDTKSTSQVNKKETTRKNVEEMYVTPEEGTLHHSANLASNFFNESDPEKCGGNILIDLSDVDEMKKAIIYSEILTPKYGFSSKNS
jgi:hypothetical protein